MVESIIFLFAAMFLVAVGVWYLVSLNKSEKQLTEEKLSKHTLSFEDRWNMEKHIAAVKGVRLQGLVLAWACIGLFFCYFGYGKTFSSLDIWMYLWGGALVLAIILFGIVAIRAVCIYQKIEKL